MEFSESLNLGNSTFIKLENLMKDGTKVERNDSNQLDLPHADVIDESPTKQSYSQTRAISARKDKTKTILHCSRLQRTRNVSRCSKFSKSKSDSSLGCSNQNQVGQTDNYSDFFRSEFQIEENFDENLKLVKADVSDAMRISKIQAALEDGTRNDCESKFEEPHHTCEESVLDTALFSEDFKVVFQEESQQNAKIETGYKEIEEEANLCQGSLLSCNKPGKGEELDDRVDVLPHIDETSFITNGIDEIQRVSVVELKRSMRTVSQVLEEEEEDEDYQPKNKKKNNTIASVSLPSYSNINELSKTERFERHENHAVEVLTGNREALKQISAWHLPQSIQYEYEKKGIHTMFDWQVECLSNPKVLFEHKNLVYSAPTSAGKTLISEILLIKTVVERFKKVLFILPFISVVREKMFYLQDLLLPSGYRVEGFCGGYTPAGGFDSINVAISTIEKANTIVNKLMEQKKLNDIGLVIVDEVHLVSDPGRGYILELLLAKILYMCRRYSFQIQIITMSATLSNVKLLQRWLQAESYITDFRPVALQEMIKIGNKIYDKDMKLLRELNTDCEGFDMLENDAEHVAQLCIETLDANCSVLVFCPSKDWCEKLAMQLAAAICSVGKGRSELSVRLRAQLNHEAIMELKRQLKELPTGLDTVLERTIRYGCAFHHAGLTTEERGLVEASFKSGTLKIIVATSTLSSGVNLPARRVLIRSPLFGGKKMSSLTYRQMIGRAGRTGKDTVGESILMCTESNARSGRELITTDLKPIISCLGMENSTHLKRALLEVISSGVASTKQNVEQFVSCTLLHTEKDTTNTQGVLSTEEEDSSSTETDGTCTDGTSDCITESLEFLIEYEFIRLQSQNEENNKDMYVATRLGLACLASSMPPRDGLLLFAELQKSRRCFVLETDLHAVYLATPYSVCYQLQDIDWLFYLDLWEKLKPAMKKVGEIVGVKESFLVRAMRGQSNLDYKLLQIHKRFYTALALHELVNETPINQVSNKYRCTRGLLQTLQQMSSTFAGIVTAFCSSLNWSTLALVLAQFKERLFFGVHHDLIDLMRLPELNQKRARALFDAGITNLIQLANADVAEVEKILYNSLSFDSAKQQDNENARDVEKRQNERILFITGRKGITVSEAANMLIHDARAFVQYEIGVGSIHWTRDESKGSSESERESGEEIRAKNETIMSPSEESLNPKQTNRKGLEENLPSDIILFHDDEQKNEETPVAKSLKKSGDNLVSNKFKANKINESSKDQEKVQNNLVVKQNLGMNHASSSCPPEKQDHHCQEVKVTRKIIDQSQRRKNTEKFTHNEISTKLSDNQREIISTDTSKDLKKPKLNPVILDPQIPSKKCKIELENRNEHNFKREHSSEKAQNHLKKESNGNFNSSASKFTNKENIVKDTVLVKEESFDNDVVLPTRPSTKILRRRSPRNKILTSTRIEITAKFSLNKEKPKESGIMAPASEYVQSLEPHRSPRNLKVTNNFKTSSEDENLFSNKVEHEIFTDGDNSDSFQMNTDIAQALKIADNMVNTHTPCPPTIGNNLNKSNDEIPSSQQCDNDDDRTQTPQRSRLLRSCRKKRKHSPSQGKVAQQQQQPQPSSSSDNVTVNSNYHSHSAQQCDVISTDSVKNIKSDFIEISDVSTENSLMQNPQHLNAPHNTNCFQRDSDTNASSSKNINIIDICSNRKLFKACFKELTEARRIGLSLGLQKDMNKCQPLIGSNVLANQVTDKEADEIETMQFALDDNSNIYLAGIAFSFNGNNVIFMNMQNEGTCADLTKELKLKYLSLLLKSKECTFLMHDAKEQLKILHKILPETLNNDISLEDPKVANWLLQPDNNLNFAKLAQKFAPECSALIKLCITACNGYGSVGLDANNEINAKVRCSIEACVTRCILKGQIESLERIGSGQLVKFFRELEMPLQLSLSKMEYYGFPAKASDLRKLLQKMVETMKKLEIKIYELHGSRFNITSTVAVGKVLGLHRKSNGRVSTARHILEKIDSPISQLIITYRKLSSTIAKTVQPLLKCVINDRIHGQSITSTATGRISMTEPNLQNVAKDFQVEFGAEDKVMISCRSAFSPIDVKRCLIAADFCQLEMCILAHLSQDKTLLQVLNSETDVFIALAARWNQISADEVSEQLRNGTKQICYGIIYGMGIRSLAGALKCTEDEAVKVSQQFHEAYPGIRIYTERIIKFARTNGYIETITGRRRYLEHINSSENNMRGHAERQAINSTIQGSAADIAKSAILRMEKNIKKYSDKLGINATSSVHLVLHVHDELIYEVPADKAKKIAKVLSVTMENCVKLSVPLRVKLKIGKSWGELKEVKL